jgi:hypothetical protein
MRERLSEALIILKQLQAQGQEKWIGVIEDVLAKLAQALRP